MADQANELRSQLRVASRAAMQYGATDKQISFIVALAVKTGDFNVLGNSGTLTKFEASRIIDVMKNPLV